MQSWKPIVRGVVPVRLRRRARTVAARMQRILDGKPAVYPTRFDPPHAPVDLEGDSWPEPPESLRSGATGRSLYETGHRPEAFDVELLEALNEEYRHKPVVPVAPSYAPTRLAEAARRRLVGVHRSIDLFEKRVLEFGCGNGYEIWYLATRLGCDAYGVDVVERLPWADLKHDRTHFQCIDLTVESPFPADFFDRIISFAVLEHVVHPYRALEALYRMLRPGGLAYLRANLFCGPTSSHLYREIFFPWPHLLFSDEVIEAFYVGKGAAPRRAAWVNRLSWFHYEHALRSIGFKIRMLRFDERPIDESLYSRFEDTLGRYPRSDLERDFFTVIVEK